MRRFVRVASLLMLLMSGISLQPLAAQQQSATPGTLATPANSNIKSLDTPCSPSYQSKYPGGTCLLAIDRNDPKSKNAITVPRGTMVTIRVVNARPLEVVTFDEKNAEIPHVNPMDFFVQQVLDPLQHFVATQRSHIGAQSMTTNALIFKIEDDPLYKTQLEIQKTLDDIHLKIVDVNAELSCLAAYEVVDFNPTPYACNTKRPLNPTTFEKARQHTICDIKGGGAECSSAALRAGVATIPIAASQASAGTIAKAFDDISKGNTPIGQDEAKFNTLLTNQARLDDQIKDLQAAQKILSLAGSVLETLPDKAQAEIKKVQIRDSTDVVTLTATEQINKTSVVLGAVTITWQSTPWHVSTGIVFSGLANNSFSNDPIILSGQPVLDSGGKVTTVVAEHTTQPTIVFPLVMANYRVHEFMSCNTQCAIHLSGGVGVNLANTTTEFAAGASYQYGVVLFTPLVHIGRVDQLTSGVAVGNKLGSDPPALPQSKTWGASFGFGVSYVLPFK